MGFHQITALYRFLFLLVFSAALMIVDFRSQLLAPVRMAGSVINLPFQLLIHLPTAAREWIDANYPDDSLHRKYAALAEKQLQMEARLQRYEALQAENQRLAELLSISRSVGERVVLAEIVDIGLNRYTHRVALNRGSEAGVYAGQPAITPDGVLGQISGVGVLRSVITLLTDPGHALPVEVQRNGLRTIVQGLGATHRLNVPFLPAHADIRTGDILVTSGMGGGFPAGYRVAQVREIASDANEAFLRVSASTFADVDFAKEVLLLSGERPETAAAGDEQTGE